MNDRSEDSPPTQRQLDALRVLADPSVPAKGLTPAGFAAAFWPGKIFARGNGPWGLGPDASGRHGGRMLTRLLHRGWVRTYDYGGGVGYTAVITPAGRAVLAKHSEPIPCSCVRYSIAMADMNGEDPLTAYYRHPQCARHQNNEFPDRDWLHAEIADRLSPKEHP